MRWQAAALGCALVACGSSQSEPTRSKGVEPAPRDPVVDAWTSAPAPEAPPARAPKVVPLAGEDFAGEVALLFRVVACSGSGALPENIDESSVAAHCRDLLPKMEAYRKRYVAVAKPFLAALKPKELPSSVVYPFGGGDLVTALTTYPDALEFTTISLELAGDPRRVRTMEGKSLEPSLRKLRGELSELLLVDDYSKSETLKRTQRGELPDELSFFLVALAIHGFEPISLRYFRFEPTGVIHYLTESDIAAVDDKTADHRKGSWTSPDFSEAFANSEIRFRPIGSTGPVRVHRHVAQNLADDHLKYALLLPHLEKKGRVAAMTKAASYLLWNDGFSLIRSYLVNHLEFMVSDSTGIPPVVAFDGGLVQETYGEFKSSLLHAPTRHNDAFKKLWGSQPARKVPFRYGYKDSAGHAHLLVTKRAPKPAP